MNGQYQDYQRCPSCKESCDAVSDEEEKPIEKITIEFDLNKWEAIRNHCFLTNEVDYKIKDVIVVDEMFKNDNIHKAYKKASLKAYKDLKDYEFKTRHNIK